MDTAQWPQGIGVVKPMEEASRPMLERRGRPQKDQALNCPRCNSTNTKFCYYNNYSLSQPRYFCKTCRRYWTEGGSLRNVPVGGGSRKNKRSSTSSSPSSSTSSPASSKKVVDLTQPCLPRSASQNPKIHEGQDLNLAYPPPTEDYNSLSKFVQPQPQNSGSTSTSTHLNSMELMKSTGFGSGGLSSFMSIPVSDSNTPYNSNSTVFPIQDFKPTLNFSLDGFETGYGNLQSGARLLFPTEELKQVQSTNNELEQNRSQGESTGYWGEMLGGGNGQW